jgi:hypothetical protein
MAVALSFCRMFFRSGDRRSYFSLGSHSSSSYQQKGKVIGSRKEDSSSTVPASKKSNQCGGSGMILPDPSSRSIPDTGSKNNNKRGVGTKNLLFYGTFFVATNVTKLKMI